MTQPQPASASARFPDESILPVFTDLRMTAFGRTVIDIAADPIFDSWSFSDKVLYALDKEVAAKRERRVNKLLNTSRSPNLDACIEDITYTPGRNLNKEQITRLAHCQWCQKHKTLSSSANHPSEKPTWPKHCLPLPAETTTLLVSSAPIHWPTSSWSCARMTRHAWSFFKTYTPLTAESCQQKGLAASPYG